MYDPVVLTLTAIFWIFIATMWVLDQKDKRN